MIKGWFKQSHKHTVDIGPDTSSRGLMSSGYLNQLDDLVTNPLKENGEDLDHTNILTGKFDT